MKHPPYTMHAATYSVCFSATLAVPFLFKHSIDKRVLPSALHPFELSKMAFAFHACLFQNTNRSDVGRVAGRKNPMKTQMLKPKPYQALVASVAWPLFQKLRLRQ
jgi:hypothetical protein